MCKACSRVTIWTLAVLQKCSDVRKHDVLLHCNKQYMHVANNYYAVESFPACQANQYFTF